MSETVIERDRWDRPLIIPPDGGKPTAYTRVSTLSKTLSDSGNLIDWKGRVVAAGLASNSDLWWEAAELLGKWGFDPPFRDGKSAWNGLAERAASLAGAGKWAEIGSTIHDAIDQAFRTGLKVDVGEYAGHVEEFFRVVEADYSILATEVFVVNDRLKAAGTFDLLLQHRETGEVHVGDLKTGASDPRYPLPVTVQVAVYADSLRYDPATGERSPIAPGAISDEGVLVHLPAKVTPAECKLYPLDLPLGRSMADCSVQVREYRKMKALAAVNA